MPTKPPKDDKNHHHDHDKHHHHHDHHHHHPYTEPFQISEQQFKDDSLRIEAMTTCVGFADLLDVTLPLNVPHFDGFYVATTHADKDTQKVCRKHSVLCVQTDLFFKNNRNFNKGAAINVLQYRRNFYGWTCHLDADCIVPERFRHILFNHTAGLDQSCIYGADRYDIVGNKNIKNFLVTYGKHGTHTNNCLISAEKYGGTHSHRYLHVLPSYVPIGYCQIWHARCDRPYAYSLGTAERDDVAFALEFPADRRRLLPGIIIAHLCPSQNYVSQNWDGKRRIAKLDLKDV